MDNRFKHLEDEDLMTVHGLVSKQYEFFKSRLEDIQAKHEEVLAEMSERGLLSEEDLNG